MERRPRIALISEHASPLALVGGEDAGGQNVYVDALSRALGRLGHTVDLFTRRDNVAAPAAIAHAPGVRVVNLDAGIPRQTPRDELWPYMPAFRDAFLAFVARDGARYDAIHANFWMSGWTGIEAGRRLRLPVVQLFHALGATKRRHQGDADTSPSDRIAVERRIVGVADRLIAQCPSERAELIADYGADPDRIALIPGAVDTALFHPAAREAARRAIGQGLAVGDFVVTYVGRLLPRKDVCNIVRAMALLTAQTDRPVKLLVVGGSSPEPDPIATPEIGAIQQLAAELGIADRVLCVGRRPVATLRDYYGAGDVAVTTPWYEPYGLTPLEAMACGRPVVGAQVGGIAFTVLDGETGFLVPPRDPAALAARLRCLLDRPALCDELGAAGRRRVEREFTWALTAERTVEVIAGCADARPGAGRAGRERPVPARSRYLGESAPPMIDR